LVQDTKLFEMILGLQATWSVSRVAFETAQERVDVWVAHAADTR
jgi:hypothetical protein